MSSPALKNPSDDGRQRFGRNVAFSWGAYMVNVISGFIVPRLISDELGQQTLGIWDFSWSLVCYFGLVELGMSNSISRYVARHRAQGDVVGLNRAVSTIAIFQRLMGWSAMILAIAVAWWILPLFANKLGEGMATARWVILIQGMEIALTITLGVYGPVIVGCHRWDIHNSVSAIANGLVAFCMICVLLLGGGLPLLALAHCSVITGSALVRRSLACRVCPELVIRGNLASWSSLVEQARYNLKSVVPSIANLVSNQALSLVLVAFLGPASLAVFSRSRSLMTTMRTLAVKFGMIVVPIASEFHVRNDRDALKETLLGAPAIIASLMLPVMTTIAVFGNEMMRIWMGGAYVYPGLIAVLSIGTFATLVQEPAWSLLSGMNAHGAVAIAKLIAAFVSVGLLAVFLSVGVGGLLGAAICFVLPQVIVDGWITPWHACRILNVSKCSFFLSTFVRPIFCVSPFALALISARWLGMEHPVWAGLVLAAGCGVSCRFYLRWLIPDATKRRLSGLLTRTFIRRPLQKCL